MMDTETGMDMNAKAQVAESLQALKASYSAFVRPEPPAVTPKLGVARLFQKWFSTPDPTACAPGNAAFMEQVAEQTQRLADALAQLRDSAPQQCEEAAVEAARVMLAPKQGKSNSGMVMYQLAVEINYQLLLPYLSVSSLRQIRDEYVANNPKHAILPKQLELLKRMNACLPKG